ncbi:MAG: hypothetical protein K6F46_01390 [Desulfovibrio sp.]|nr:hypothetical protein [Desulfovibrio sp.]
MTDKTAISCAYLRFCAYWASVKHGAMALDRAINARHVGRNETILIAAQIIVSAGNDAV